MSGTSSLLLIAAAVATAAISAVLGMAGGITLLGVMTALMAPGLVVPIHGVVQLGSNLTRTLVFMRHVRWSLLLAFTPSLVVGMALAGIIWSGSSLVWLKPLIGVYILIFLVWRRWTPELRCPPYWSYVLLGAVVGFAAIFIGATGPLMAPLFLRDDFAKEQVIASKAACQMGVHLAKVGTFVALGVDFSAHWRLLGMLLAAGVVGTLIGRRLLRWLPQHAFVRLFEVTLGLLALYLIAAALIAGV